MAGDADVEKEEDVEEAAAGTAAVAVALEVKALRPLEEVAVGAEAVARAAARAEAEDSLSRGCNTPIASAGTFWQDALARVGVNARSATIVKHSMLRAIRSRRGARAAPLL